MPSPCWPTTCHVAHGGRTRPPARLEILALLLRAPAEWSLRLTLPVLLSSESHVLASFTPCTTAHELALSVRAAGGGAGG
jgi:hypothetical protein